MKLEVYYGGEKILVEVGSDSAVDCVRLPDGVHSILMDGRVYDLIVEPEGESFLVAGRQDLESDGDLIYGQSITDACMDWDTTVLALDRLASAVRKRREAA